MSNVKSVLIQGEVPFDWISLLEPVERELLAGAFLSPAVGLKLTFGQSRLDPEKNQHGGQTTLYTFNVGGQEAASWEYLRRLLTLFRKVGTVSKAWAIDIEDGRFLRTNL